MCSRGVQFGELRGDLLSGERGGKEEKEKSEIREEREREREREREGRQGGDCVRGKEFVSVFILLTALCAQIHAA